MGETPEKIGPYRVLTRLGAGGMAETFVAEKRGPGGYVQRVCVKRIRQGLDADPDYVRQFLAEARIAATLRHTNIAQVVDFGQDGPDYWLALELIEGMDLRMLLGKCGGRLSPELVAHLGVELASALDVAHRAGGAAPGAGGIVHRDVSPSNVLLSLEGEVKLTDFGIARRLDEPKHTRTGVVRGKVPYMAPEYAESGSFDHRSDLFALGVLLYEVLSGQRPHDGPADYETLRRATHGEHPALATLCPEAPAGLCEVIERLLAPDPARRTASASALLDALTPLRGGDGRRDLARLVNEHHNRKTGRREENPVPTFPSSRLPVEPEATVSTTEALPDAAPTVAVGASARPAHGANRGRGRSRSAVAAGGRRVVARSRHPPRRAAHARCRSVERRSSRGCHRDRSSRCDHADQRWRARTRLRREPGPAHCDRAPVRQGSGGWRRAARHATQARATARGAPDTRRGPRSTV